MENTYELLVLNENTLGYRIPKYPKTLFILSFLILRGAYYLGQESVELNDKSILRPVVDQDSDDFRIVLDGYKKDKDCINYN